MLCDVRLQFIGTTLRVGGQSVPAASAAFPRVGIRQHCCHCSFWKAEKGKTPLFIGLFGHGGFWYCVGILVFVVIGNGADGGGNPLILLEIQFLGRWWLVGIRRRYDWLNV